MRMIPISYLNEVPVIGIYKANADEVLQSSREKICAAKEMINVMCPELKHTSVSELLNLIQREAVTQFLAEFIVDSPELIIEELPETETQQLLFDFN